ALRLDGVVTLVDAVSGEAALDAHEEAVRQVAMADRLLITKTDLQPDFSSLAARLAMLNPAAPISSLAGTAATAGLLSCGLYDPASKAANVRRWLGEAAHEAEPDHLHAQHGDHDHRHHHRHDSRVRSLSLTHDGPLPFSAVETFLDLLLSTH